MYTCNIILVTEEYIEGHLDKYYFESFKISSYERDVLDTLVQIYKNHYYELSGSKDVFYYLQVGEYEFSMENI